MSLSGSVPFFLALPELSATDIIFEAVSGLTTTGATVITHLDALAPSLNFWRHTLHWLGASASSCSQSPYYPCSGSVVWLYTAPKLQVSQRRETDARITETAKALWLTYAGLTVAAAISLKLVGMNWFDAVCQCFSVVALGGFSTHDASIGHFDSAAIELVLMMFMLISMVNFARHFTAVRTRSLTPYRSDSEAKAMLLFCRSALSLSPRCWLWKGLSNALEALRHSGLM